MKRWNVTYPDSYNGEPIIAYFQQDAESAEEAIQAVLSQYPQLDHAQANSLQNGIEAIEIDPPGFGVIRDRSTNEMEIVYDPHSTISSIRYGNEALGYYTTVSQRDYKLHTCNQSYQDAAASLKNLRQAYKHE